MSKAKPKPSERAAVRCAIYTRKSTEEGLEQEFNSLDAQRESGEAYVKSQVGEGWECLATQYDDGGYTGGNMDRPALKRLLADIKAGLIDCVIVYKVDRLSRSLLDFSRMLEVFDQHQVAFVSVTQSFNTADSAGRLMLHILLSFAEYERSMISERTRDKMSAARRKGKYVGGTPILGYDVEPTAKKLVVNTQEASQVRAIFGLYAEHQALLPVLKEVQRRGWTNKTFQMKNGALRGGKPFTKNSLHKLLTNVTYIGKASYRGEIYAGEQPGIIDPKLWQQVQASFARNNRNGGTVVRNKHGALLKGLIRCSACNCSMVPTYAGKGNKRYHYYVCSSAQKLGWESCPSKSIPAAEIERVVIEQIKGVGQDPALVRQTSHEARRHHEGRSKELAAETTRLTRDQKKIGKEVTEALAIPGGASRLGELQQRLQANEHRQAQIGEERQALDRTLVSEADVATALGEFDPVWQTLTPREQGRVLQLLVERVEYHGGSGKVAITFQPTGIRLLADQFVAEDAA